MKKIFMIFGLVLCGLFLLLIGIGFILPSKWHVRASVVVDASPEEIHPLIEDFGNWEEWLAWNEATDPTIRIEFEGRGVGSTYAWESERYGSGMLTITRSDPQKGVWFDEKIESQEVNAHGSITFAPGFGGTIVTWDEEGEMGMQPLGGFFIGMTERMIRKFFYMSLNNLKDHFTDQKE